MDKHVGAGKLKVVVVDRETGLNKTYSNNKSGYSYNYTLTANDYMTADPTALEISGTDINPWTEVNKEETPDAKALGTEAHVNGAEWGEMENEEIVPVVK